jgi:hypothetical protein
MDTRSRLEKQSNNLFKLKKSFSYFIEEERRRKELKVIEEEP